MRRLLVGFVLVLCATVVAGCTLLPMEEDTPPAPLLRPYQVKEFKTAPVIRGEVREEVKISCEYVAAATQQLSFEAEGLVVDRVNFMVGDTVKKGDIIAELDRSAILEDIERTTNERTLLELQIAKKEAAHTLSMESVDQQIGYQSFLLGASPGDEDISAEILSLHENKKAAARSFEEAVARLHADIEACDLRLASLQKKDEMRILVAGQSGTLTYIRQLADGEKSTKRTVFATIINLDTSCFIVKNENAVHIRLGEAYIVRMGGEEYTCTGVSVEELGIDTAVLTDDRKTAAYLKPNMASPALDNKSSAYIDHLISSREDVLVIPTEAVTGLDGRVMVYCLVDGVRTVRYIETGLSAGGTTEVTSGLAEGELVVIPE